MSYDVVMSLATVLEKINSETDENIEVYLGLEGKRESLLVTPLYDFDGNGKNVLIAFSVFTDEGVYEIHRWGMGCGVVVIPPDVLDEMDDIKADLDII